MNLAANFRNNNQTLSKLRGQESLPAVIFGKETTSVAVELKKLDFERAYREAGESTLIDVQIEGEKGPRPVLVSEIQFEPATGQPIHVSFHQVALKEKVTAHVPVVITGEAPAVKNSLGVLLTLLDEIEVEAYPRDLPKEFVVDVSNLTNVNQGIEIKDLKVDPKVEIKAEPDELIVKIDYLAKEEEVVVPTTEAEAIAGVTATKELTEEEKKVREEAAKKEKEKAKE